jgi:hypothetical protein
VDEPSGHIRYQTRPVPRAVWIFLLRLLPVWLTLRLPAALLLAFLLKDWIVARLDDPEILTLILINIGGTPLARVTFFLGFGVALTALWGAGKHFAPINRYVFVVLAASVMTLVVFQLTTTPRRLTLPVVLLLATNILPDSYYLRMLPTARARDAFMAVAVGISEVCFFRQHLARILSSWTGRSYVAAGGFAAVLPGIVLASAAASMSVRFPSLVAVEQALRMSPHARVIARGDFHWMEMDAAGRLLFLTGHGLPNVLRYDLTDTTRAPLKSPISTGGAQDLAYDPAAAEIYVFNSTTHQLLYLDAESLTLKRSLAVPDLAPGDSAIGVDGATNTITLVSEADVQTGVPFIVLDRANGTARDKRDIDPGNMLLRSRTSRLYLSFFRRRTGILAYDLRTLSIVAEAPAPPLASGMYFLEPANEVLLEVPAQSRVLRFDADTLAPKGHIEAPFGVRGLAFDPKRKILLCGSLITGEVTVIELETGRWIARFYLGPWLRKIRIDAARGVAYVSSNGALYELRYGHLP